MCDVGSDDNLLVIPCALLLQIYGYFCRRSKLCPQYLPFVGVKFCYLKSSEIYLELFGEESGLSLSNLPQSKMSFPFYF